MVHETEGPRRGLRRKVACLASIAWLVFQACSFFLVFSFFLAIRGASASTYVPVGDDTYDALLYLEAEGVIESGLLASRPLSRKEVLRLIEEAEGKSGERGPVVRQVVKSLRERYGDEAGDGRYIKPVGTVYSAFVYADRDPAEFVYNNDGDEYREEGNLRLGFSSRADLRWFSALLAPESRYSGDSIDLVLRRGYLVLGFRGLELQLGKDSQWWGPGYHGSLLLSNNAEPFTMARLTNPRPVLLPWLFRHLGPFGFTLFVTRLEEHRAVPEPYLWGMRLDFKPHPYVEVGLQRTALLGGEGYSEDIETWVKSVFFVGRNDPGDPSDHRVGADLKITLPFRYQPIQIYGEAAAEDIGWHSGTLGAYIAGLYLPRLLSLERVNLRVEYADTYTDYKQNSLWYTHYIYRSGYTYKKRIIGHQMGADSDDIFIALKYLLPSGEAYAWYDRQRHNLSGDIRPTEHEMTVGLKLRLEEDLRVEGRYTHGEVENTSENGNLNLFMLTLNYSF
jgi:hypothetical protein